jgi:hypothetical protein
MAVEKVLLEEKNAPRAAINSVGGLLYAIVG